MTHAAAALVVVTTTLAKTTESRAGKPLDPTLLGAWIGAGATIGGGIIALGGGYLGGRSAQKSVNRTAATVLMAGLGPKLFYPTTAVELRVDLLQLKALLPGAGFKQEVITRLASLAEKVNADSHAKHSANPQAAPMVNDALVGGYEKLAEAVLLKLNKTGGRRSRVSALTDALASTVSL